MIYFTLGLIDILAGVISTVYWLPFYYGSDFILILCVVMFAKGVWSKIFEGDFQFLLDILTGFVLLLLFLGISFYLFSILGIIMIVKGGYTCISEFTGG